MSCLTYFMAFLGSFANLIKIVHYHVHIYNTFSLPHSSTANHFPLHGTLWISNPSPLLFQCITFIIWTIFWYYFNPHILSFSLTPNLLRNLAFWHLSPLCICHIKTCECSCSCALVPTPNSRQAWRGFFPTLHAWPSITWWSRKGSKHERGGTSWGSHPSWALANQWWLEEFKG